jgi:transcription initiation factor IIE alpha subunit
MEAEERLPSVTTLLLPSPWSVGLVLVTGTWLLLGSGCTSIVFFGSGMVSALLGIFVVPGAALFAFVAALVSPTASARAAMMGTTTLLLALGAFLLAVSGFDHGFDVGSLLVSILIYAVPMAVAGTLTVFFGTRAAREVDDRLEERRVELLRRTLLVRREATFEELAEASGVPDTKVDDVLDRLKAAGAIDVELDATTRRAFTAECFAGKEQQLVATVYQRGRAAIYDVARELGLSEERLREVLYAALQHRRFAGYVDWRRGIVFSADARQLRDGRACPNCGGTMDLAGGGVIACPYCRTEVLVQ